MYQTFLRSTLARFALNLWPLLLAGCASWSAPSTPAPAVAAVPAGTLPAPGPLRPFAEVVKGATRTDGLFTLWQKDDKVWLELKPADLGQPFFLSPKSLTGLGEARFLGGLMGRAVAIEFRRVHNLVQMLARNDEFVAQAGTPAAHAVQAAYSPSLLASAAVLSHPHPDSQAVLVEANTLFVNDMLGTGMQLQRSYRQGYALDLRNSAITALRATPELVVLEVMNHYATAALAPSTPPGMPGPSVPRSLPDARSLFIGIHYSLARLPQPAMPPRKADARLGHFASNVTDFSDDLARTPRQRFVNRWRLEKKDASAALSPPVQPITFWIDKTVPLKYRAPITAGVLEWNKAFEKIGFRGALEVAVQPDDAAWDTLDFGRASIRWMTNSSPSFGAVGPSHVDPRSGEILDADIAIESLSSRQLRALRAQVLAPHSHDGASDEASAPSFAGTRIATFCQFADQAAEQLAYALDVFEARGEIDPAGEQAERFVHDYLKDVTMHEVGHALGLRHNFRSSRYLTEAQLADPAYTAENGITGSVMDYAPINLAAPGVPRERWGTPFNATIGPYDHWAIEYAYKPIAAQDEGAELARIAARSAEPQLAYGTDEDNFLGVDPESLPFDLGSDAVAFARKRVAIARDLLARQETRELASDQDYAVLRRSVSYALGDMGRAATVLTRQIGGVRTLRDHAGSGRDPLQPVSVAQQREALNLLASAFLSADSFEISPALQRKLAIDYQERSDAVFRGEAMAPTDFSLASRVVGLQRAVLAQLLSDGVAARLLDSESKAPAQALRLSELYTRLNRAVWSELGAARDVPALRRELQREHVNRVAALLLRPASLSRADARSLMRLQAQALLARMQSAARRGGLSQEARAHLQDSADTLSQALSAKLLRSGA